MLQPEKGFGAIPMLRRESGDDLSHQLKGCFIPFCVQSARPDFGHNFRDLVCNSLLLLLHLSSLHGMKERDEERSPWFSFSVAFLVSSHSQSGTANSSLLSIARLQGRCPHGAHIEQPGTCTHKETCEVMSGRHH